MEDFRATVEQVMDRHPTPIHLDEVIPDSQVCSPRLTYTNTSG